MISLRKNLNFSNLYFQKYILGFLIKIIFTEHFNNLSTANSNAQESTKNNTQDINLNEICAQIGSDTKVVHIESGNVGSQKSSNESLVLTPVNEKCDVNISSKEHSGRKTLNR